MNRYEEVVKILLGWGNVSSKESNEDGNIPLGCTAQCGHERVVKMLLEPDDIYFDKLNESCHIRLYYTTDNRYK